MSQEAASPAPHDLVASSAFVGAYCAIERSLFELTGSIATRPELPPEVQVFLDAMSTQHAWHAELWADRLPVVGGIDAEALVVVPEPVGAVVSDLFSMGHIERLAGLFRVVVPRLIVSYGRHASVASPVSDSPTLRALTLVLRDETEEWTGGESLVQRLLGTPEAVSAAAGAVAGLESQLVQAGLVPGLVPWPGRRA